MGTHQRSIRMPDHLDAEVERERRRRPHAGWSDQVIELVDEGIRMRRCPGIVFRDGSSGRRAVIEEEWANVRASFPQLTEHQLRAALNYYAVYPAEVDARLAIEAEWTPERLARELPLGQGLPG
jgi:hypothetical protein